MLFYIFTKFICVCDFFVVPIVVAINKIDKQDADIVSVVFILRS